MIYYHYLKVKDDNVLTRISWDDIYKYKAYSAKIIQEKELEQKNSKIIKISNCPFDINLEQNINTKITIYFYRLTLFGYYYTSRNIEFITNNFSKPRKQCCITFNIEEII